MTLSPPQLYDVAEVAIIHEYILAKFDDIQNVKVENLMHPFILL
jgi:hypothetical protein